MKSNKTIWIIGRPSSGKSTFAKALKNQLEKDGRTCIWLDGDTVRNGISVDLGFSHEDRLENNRRMAETAKIISKQGILVICSSISPTHKIRNTIKSILGTANYFEVFIQTPVEICIQRDSKGLYEMAEKGLLKNFTGIDSVFEDPLAPGYLFDFRSTSLREGVLETIRRLGL